MKNTTTRIEEVVGHAVRFNMTTNSAIHVMTSFSQSHISTVEKFTAELCRTNWLTDYTFRHPSKYFVPGPKAVKHFGLARRASNARGPQAFPIDFATLLYCSQHERDVVRLRRAEIGEKFSWYRPEWMPHAHILCRNGQRLALEMLRLAHVGHPNTIVRKCWEAIEKRCQSPEARAAISRREFRLVIVVGTQVRARSLQNDLARLNWTESVEIKFAVIPEMLTLTNRC